MKIELSKKIKQKKIQIIAEVNFYDKASPYVKYLNKFNTAYELIEDLKKLNSQSAIDNIINNLIKLEVISKDGEIKDVEKGFPITEYGKYEIDYFENDNIFPFEYKVINITRIDTEGWNYNKEVKSLDKVLINELKKDKTKYKILKIENNQGVITNNKEVSMKIKYDSNNKKWNYSIENKSYKMEPIALDKIFVSNWVNNHFEVDFDIKELSKDELLSFTKKEFKTKLNVENYGTYSIKIVDIPIAPISDNNSDAEKWLLYILKHQLSLENDYISEDYFEQIRDSIYFDTPELFSFKNLKLPSANETVNQIDKTQKSYLMLKTCLDLNPYSEISETSSFISSSSFINIKESELKDYFSNKSKLVIIDRYINTKRHFDSLFNLQDAFNLNISIVTTDFFKRDKASRKDEIKEVERELKQRGIKRTVLEKNNIPHDRYWKIDNKIFTVSKSIDFIKVIDDKVKIDQVFIDERVNSEIDENAKRLLKK